jgi:hypothetical protein
MSKRQYENGDSYYKQNNESVLWFVYRVSLRIEFCCEVDDIVGNDVVC